MKNFPRNNSPEQNLSPLSVGFLGFLREFCSVWLYKNVQVIPVSLGKQRVMCSTIVFRNSSKNIVWGSSYCTDFSCDLSFPSSAINPITRFKPHPQNLPPLFIHSLYSSSQKFGQADSSVLLLLSTFSNNSHKIIILITQMK